MTLWAYFRPSADSSPCNCVQLLSVDCGMLNTDDEGSDGSRWMRERAASHRTVLSLPQLIAHCIMVVMAIMFPTEFTPEVHVAMDKFLAALALALAEKYR